MKPKIILLAAALLAVSAASAVIPQPRSIETRKGAFVLTASATLAYGDETLRPLAVYMLDYGIVQHVAHERPDKNFISLALDPSLGGEAYTLTVENDGITIVGGGYGGVFNGIQTLFQLLPSDIYSKNCRLPSTVACVYIEDEPQFSYRGFLLDVTRTWSDADRVKRYIDLISYHKINKLHLLLSNDEGWRLEIKSHPELVQFGAWRGGNSPVKSVYGKFGERYGGYFTQRTMREIIDYAAVRNVEIIPEIDLPGHSRTMAQIHPEILCDYDSDLGASNGYEYRSAWCVTRDENYELLEDILGEVCELFPSEYINIGGDEVDMSQWKHCPHCSSYVERHLNGDYHRLEDLFMSRAGEILAQHGKKAGVWNEAVNGGTLAKNARVYGWENIEACKKSTSKGYHTVVMPGQYFYLDMRQSQHEFGHRWAAIFDVRQCYSFDFDKQGFNALNLANVEGVEASFFSELYVAHEPETCEYLDYMLFPRLCAVSEIAWGKHGSDWEHFDKRLKNKHYDCLAGMGICFRLPPPTVGYADGRLTASTDENAAIFWSKEHDGKWYRYTSPIRTDKPAEYLFRTEYRTAHSPAVSVSEYYREIKPAFTLTSTIPASENRPYSMAESYRGDARTSRTCRAGDMLVYQFAEPLICREIEFRTGHQHLAKHLFDSGYLEVSLDGEHFERVAELKDGRAKLLYPEPFRVARIVSTCNGNGTPYVVVPPPVIKPLL